MNKTTLDRLQPGQWAVITGLGHSPDMNRRLRDMGLIEGTHTQCLHRSPWGSPAAYLVRGATIAIRSRDGALVQVTQTPTKEQCHGKT